MQQGSVRGMDSIPLEAGCDLISEVTNLAISTMLYVSVSGMCVCLYTSTRTSL